MGLYRVVAKEGQKALDYLAGATRGEGCPLGMWASFENDIAPNDNWIRAGTTFDATAYPSLALYLGGNTVPKRYDHSRLRELENFTISTDSTNPTVMNYDGFIGIETSFGGSDNNISIYINGQKALTTGGAVNVHNVWFPVRAGDEVYYTYYNYNVYSIKARFYKHPLFIKASSNMSESEATGILNLINQRESYSTEEINTGKKWIDGKPIYRKAYYTSGRLQDNLVIATDVHRLVNVGGTIDTNESSSVAFPRVIPSYIREVRINNSDHTLRTWLETSVNGADIWVEYTKTTD